MMKWNAGSAAVALVGWSLLLANVGYAAQGEADDRPAIAAICTYYQPFMHSDVIVSKFLLGFPTDEGLIPPDVRIASLYIDQGPDDSLGHQLARMHDIPVFATIEEALTLGGADGELAVDGVLLIGEHGEYPINRYGQVMYPRMLWMKQVLRVFEASDRVVPVYNDKQLAYNWLDARWMYDRAQQLGVPLMAGSVIPLVWRDPPDFEQPRGQPITDAVILFHGGVDRYAIHGLEMLQSLVEHRAGGESGVRRVETLSGDDFHAAMEDGRIPRDMVDQTLREHAGFGLADRPLAEHVDQPVAFLLDYNDGLRAALLQLNNYYGQRWFYAARVDGEVVTCEFRYLDDPRRLVQPVAAFSYLGLNIQEMFLTGRPQYPIERTLLATGLSEAAIRSHRHDGAIETPWLNITYEPYAFEPIRPKQPRPAGASVAPWPEDEDLRQLFEWR